MPEEVFEATQPIQPAAPKPTNWPKIILATVLGFGLLATAAYAGYWYGTESAEPSAPPVGGQPKTQIPETPIPTPTPSVEDETKEWKTFSGSAFDIAFKYPSDWVAETGYAQDGAFDFECSMITDWLKDPSSCSGTHKSPSVTVHPRSAEGGGLFLWGPTSGLGGMCRECDVVNRSVIVSGKTYTVPVKIYTSEGRYSTLPDGGVIVETSGDSSIWSQIDVEFDTASKGDYETILEILSTIKPN